MQSKIANAFDPDALLPEGVQVDRAQKILVSGQGADNGMGSCAISEFCPRFGF